MCVFALHKGEVHLASYIGLFYRALLQKRPIILRRLLIVATPHAIRGGECERCAFSPCRCAKHMFAYKGEQDAKKHIVAFCCEKAKRHTSHHTHHCELCEMCIFQKNIAYCLFYRALLQKRPIILRSLLTGSYTVHWERRRCTSYIRLLWLHLFSFKNTVNVESKYRMNCVIRLCNQRRHIFVSNFCFSYILFSFHCVQGGEDS